MTLKRGCPFCNPAQELLIQRTPLCLALWDRYPVTAGHALIVPRRHIASMADATAQERTALFELLDMVRAQIADVYAPDGYNIGINDGQAAGQTVPHLHIHLIPRYAGDVPDPTGGVRFVIPDRANYRRDPGLWDDADAGRLTIGPSQRIGPQTTAQDAATTGCHLPSSAARPAQHRADALISGLDDPLLPHLRAHLDLAERVDIAVAFTMDSGLSLIKGHLTDLLARGGVLRFLTGDYLDVTEPSALRSLLDLRTAGRGDVGLRIFGAHESGLGFHPKAYILRNSDGTGTAIIGSSNLSATALGKSTPGVEWNYQVVTTEEDGGVFATVLEQFERLYSHPATAPLSYDWIRDYAKRHRPTQHRPVPTEPLVPPPEPHRIQRLALRALGETRAEGNTAGLVVLATGLGKTWLSAFDSKEYRRVLFVAHREEILDQALSTYRRIRTDAHLGKFTGKEKDADADILFASVQTLSRGQHMLKFGRDHFNYIVMDEFHHASAATYRRVLDYFDADFLLGLTATPERSDGGDLLALCQENLVFRCDLGRGIEEELLCPFRYYGVADEVEYANIPWRSGRFDEETLTTHVATRSRAQNALEQWQEHGRGRTMAFCCSVVHARFMRGFFQENGIASAAVHGGPDSDPRTASLERLADGELDVVFSVDMFNEGLDLPELDTIMMLRPTESPVLWLQQFGRGLRRNATGDKVLTVIDYIGNHKAFLNKPRGLLGALMETGPGNTSLWAALRKVQDGTASLPPGCEITYDLESITWLLKLLEPPQTDELTALYRSHREEHGKRPTAAQLYHAGFNPGALRKQYGSWLRFVKEMGDASQHEQELLDGRTGRFLQHLETTPMTKSYKMVMLLAMLRLDALPGRAQVASLTREFARVCRRSRKLADDVTVSLADNSSLRRLLEQNPINAFAGGRGMGGECFFDYADGVLTCNMEIPTARHAAFAGLVRELVEWRLCAYQDRPSVVAPAAGLQRIICKVSHADGRPILFLPDRTRHPDLPEGWISVRAEGRDFEANFGELAVDVMRSTVTNNMEAFEIASDQGHDADTDPSPEHVPAASAVYAPSAAGGVVRSESADYTANALPDLLRSWFGERAGQPGTTHEVAFVRDSDVLRLEPV